MLTQRHDISRMKHAGQVHLQNRKKHTGLNETFVNYSVHPNVWHWLCQWKHALPTT